MAECCDDAPLQGLRDIQNDDALPSAPPPLSPQPSVRSVDQPSAYEQATFMLSNSPQKNGTPACGGGLVRPCSYEQMLDEPSSIPGATIPTLALKITGTQDRDRVTFYDIHVRFGQHCWTMSHRFSTLRCLYKAWKKLLGKAIDFPRRSFLCVVPARQETRQPGLQRFLDACVDAFSQGSLTNHALEQLLVFQSRTDEESSAAKLKSALSAKHEDSVAYRAEELKKVERRVMCELNLLAKQEASELESNRDTLQHKLAASEEWLRVLKFRAAQLEQNANRSHVHHGVSRTGDIELEKIQRSIAILSASSADVAKAAEEGANALAAATEKYKKHLHTNMKQFVRSLHDGFMLNFVADVRNVPADERLALLTDKYGFTALEAAIELDSVPALRILLDAVPEDAARLALFKSRQHTGGTVLHLAASHNEVLSALLLKGVPHSDKISFMMTQDGDGDTVLHKVAKLPIPSTRSVAVIKVLLSAIPEASAREAFLLAENKSGRPALLEAVFNSRLKAAEILLDALPEGCDKRGILDKRDSAVNLTAIAYLRKHPDTAGASTAMEQFLRSHGCTMPERSTRRATV